MLRLLFQRKPMVLGVFDDLVTIFDLGEEQGKPHMVTELMVDGDVE